MPLMSENKKLQYIAHKRKREVAYCKRKRSLLKKLIEISHLCDLDIFLVVFDKSKQKLLEYRTEIDFSVDVVKGLLEPDIKRNLKYDLFTNNKQTLSTESEDEASIGDSNKLDKIEFKKNSQTLTSMKKFFHMKEEEFNKDCQ